MDAAGRSRGRSFAQWAVGRVWESGAADSAAALSWLTGRGRDRNLGAPPEGAQLVAPSLEDGYMLLTAPATASVP